MKRTHGVIAVLGVAGVVGGVYVWSKGGFSEAFKLPAVLAASTSKEQDGVELLGICRSTESDPTATLVYSGFPLTSSPIPLDTTRVWLRLPDSGLGRPRFNGLALRFMVATSDGVSAPLPWSMADIQNRIVFVTIPLGYTDKTEWVDLVMEGTGEPKRTWRIARLPQPRRAFAGPESAQVRLEGVTISAKAGPTRSVEIAAQPEEKLNGVVVVFSVAGTATDASRKQRVSIDSVEMEWSGSADDGTVPRFFRPVETKTDLFAIENAFAFARLSKWVRVKGVLRTYAEEVKPITVRGVKFGAQWLGSNRSAFTIEPANVPVDATYSLQSTTGTARTTVAYRLVPPAKLLTTGDEVFEAELQGGSLVTTPTQTVIDDAMSRFFKTHKAETLKIGDMATTVVFKKVVSETPFTLIVPMDAVEPPHPAPLRFRPMLDAGFVGAATGAGPALPGRVAAPPTPSSSTAR